MSFFPLADLELAAEIGKNLLERNKELEVMLKSSHQYLEEQSVKNEVRESTNIKIMLSVTGTRDQNLSRMRPLMTNVL